jgi:hypothetical protein
VIEQRERGVWWRDLEREIGIPAETLKRWAMPRATSSVLRPVEVIDAPATGTVTLVSPTVRGAFDFSNANPNQKRLEKGTSAKLWRDDGQVVRLTASELALYVEGCTLVGKHALSPMAVERKPLVSDRGM